MDGRTPSEWARWVLHEYANTVFEDNDETSKCRSRASSDNPERASGTRRGGDSGDVRADVRADGAGGDQRGA